MVYILFSAIHSDSFLELISDIWIIGSSIIKWTSEHTKNRATGRDLGLDKQGYNVIWVGHQGMLWYMVDTVISIMLSWRRPPAIILIHCGGNDLCKLKNGKLLFSIKSSLADIQRRLPDTTIIWSYILPRRNWLSAIHNESVNRSRKRLNRGVISFLQRNGGKAINHVDLEDLHPALFRDDGTHLSYLGNGMFINALQSALELFIKNPYRTLYPDELY